MVAKQYKKNVEDLDDERHDRDKYASKKAEDKMFNLKGKVDGSDLEKKTSDIYQKKVDIKRHSGKMYGVQLQMQHFFYDAAVNAKERFDKYDNVDHDLEDILKMIPGAVQKVTDSYSKGRTVAKDATELVLLGWADPVLGTNKVQLNQDAMDVAVNYKNYLDSLEKETLGYIKLLRDLEENF